MRNRTVLAGVAAAVVLVAAAAPAEASVHKSKPASWRCDFDDQCTKNTRSGPGAAAVRYWFLGDFSDTLIRAGNAGFGFKHIQAGGSTKNKANHPTDAAAVKLWDKALNNNARGSKGEKYKGGWVHTYKYKGGSQARTMCVATDDQSYTYDHKNYGRKGIITAYWVPGHVGWKGCTKG
ncbi:hypothetical protein ACFP51_33650 [Streptomyces pratens]|uniref:Peptidase inhibitor family I36 protein n=1 Tax=Streptomyces pratens TaxID=887456 RepID=A0ABW1M2X6_9ACTN